MNHNRSAYPDRILHNGNIITVDARFSAVSAVAIRGERFEAVGSDKEVLALAGPDTILDNLDGRTVLPGLIDTHAHVEEAGLLRHTLSLEGARSIPDAQEKIARFARERAPGEWILGQTWHPQSQLREKRFLTRWEIDEAAPDNPVYLPISHYALLNSCALAAAGITRDTLDPDGGEIRRDAEGEPDGVLVEAAERLVVQAFPGWSDAARREQLRDAQAYFNAFGLTSAVSAAVKPRDMRLYNAIRRAGELTLRLSLMVAPTGDLNPDMSVGEWEDFLSMTGVSSGFGDAWLSLAGLKLQVDGGMTLRTAAMRDAYPDDPNYFGLCIIEPDKFDRLVKVANRHDWRVGVHAVGDRAIDIVLDAFERANGERSIAGRRFIVIHASLMQLDQMERAKGLDVRVDAQSTFLWHKAGTVATFLGEATANRAVPMRDLIDHLGIDRLGAGTDYPINDLSPFINIYVMTTRRDASGAVYGSDQRITREEAIRLYTSAAARYAFAEADTGSIEPGKLADLVVLSDDIMSVDDEALKGIRALRTIVGGRVVFER